MLTVQRIVIVEDHTLLRQGLSAMISADPDVEVVGEADNGRDAIRLAGSLSPNLMLMDLSMPGTNGTESILEIKRRYPKIKVLVLTVHKAEEYVREALKAGADGYVLKHATLAELMVAIKSVLRGKTYLSPDVAEQVVSGYLFGGKGPNQTSTWDSITLREREVLKLIAEGHPNKFIANYLCVSVKTIEKHRSNLMKKLDMHNAASLAVFAIEKGLIVPQ
ncbi:response regulator [Methylotenera versatilis]|uniref:Two component transcriptional regulator, LuxR family n=1 Tax=Methylotenera versatilis (strain 301) TaxID=666681 RepID=D7DME3_METV0|nr:response regulator transcription factor [Methylotenera versatilis]ADI28854.1 two component transcriptional regulator, LuxR family [Methylotenera versatilis 301]